MDKPEKMTIDHQEDGQDCGCVAYEVDTPCEMRANAFNDSCGIYEKREQELLQWFKKHYRIYGYEKNII